MEQRNEKYYSGLSDEELEKRYWSARYEVADLLREKIRRKGWDVQDTPEGTILKKHD